MSSLRTGSAQAARALLWMLSVWVFACSGEPPAEENVWTLKPCDEALGLQCACNDGSAGVVLCDERGRPIEQCQCLGEVDMGGAQTDGGAGRHDSGGGELNACGGTGQLKSADGASDAKPNEACGECGGRLACDGPERLACVGDRELNGCGTCGELSEAPGSACGECGYGRWACATGADGEATGAMECVGDVGQNACGGCTLLDASRSPESECFNEATMEQGAWQCVSRNRTDCISQTSNACGGGGALTIEGGLAAGPGDLPFERCGSCGDGFYICGDPNTLSCADESAANGCGGCGVLRAAPGTPCGSCGGTWRCDAANTDVVCGTKVNACGGCSALDAIPGEACGEGQGDVVVCRDLESTECVVQGGETSLNGCGGMSTLAHAPNQPCGACGDGAYVCVSQNETSCLDAGPVNACGGCATLTDTPGTACGQYSHGSYEVWTCNGLDAVECDNPSGMTNECGGVEVLLPKRRGEACGLCDGGTYECSGGGLTCDEEPDTMTDAQHCGGCDMPCNSGEQCVAGLCEGGSDAYFVDVAAGMEHACGLRSNGVITCWGNPGQGRRGTSANMLAPPALPATDVQGVSDAVKIGAGRDFTCAVRAAGTVHCWGANEGGQLGHDTGGLPQTDPAAGQVQGVSNVIDLAVGLRGACVIQGSSLSATSGQVKCWGEGFEESSMANPANSYDELINVPAWTATPWVARAVALPSNAFQVDLSNWLGCAVVAGGDVYCWGRGALGSGPTWDAEQTAPESMPVRNIVVSGALDVKVSDTAYYSHACALLGSKKVTCWGNNDRYQLGRPSAGGAAQLIAGLNDVEAFDVSEQMGCAIRTNGSMVCWGRPENYSVMGNGGLTVSDSTIMLHPVIEAQRPALDGTAQPIQGVQKLSLFDSHKMNSFGQQEYRHGVNCLLRGQGADAEIRCWGEPRGGAMGDGQEDTGTVRSRPHPILGLDATPPVESGQCRDGLDNDNDGVSDLEDEDCAVQMGSELSALIPMRDWGQYETPSCFVRTDGGPTIRVAWQAPTNGTYRFARGPSSSLSAFIEVLDYDAALAHYVPRPMTCTNTDGNTSLDLTLTAGEEVYLLVHPYGSSYNFYYSYAYHLAIERLP